jgi:hypothetical protein
MSGQQTAFQTIVRSELRSENTILRFELQILTSMTSITKGVDYVVLPIAELLLPSGVSQRNHRGASGGCF